MTSIGPLGFDEWVEHCFTSTTPDWYWAEGAPEYRASPESIAAHLMRLCREAPTHLASYSDEQLTIGIWYVFGVSSCFVGQAEKAGRTQAAELYESIPLLYNDFFASRCSDSGEVDTDLDTAVYMLWDMGQLTVIPREESPQGFDVSLEAVESILFESDNSTCQLSALHALSDHEFRIPHDRFKSIINRFMTLKELHESVRKSASNVLNHGHL